MEHRGVEYAIRKIADNQWEWTIYGSKSSGAGKVRGTVTGTREDAEAACKREIDSGLDGFVPR